MSKFNHILVVGAGQMGSGIAQVCAQAGFQVTVQDVNGGSLEKSSAGINKQLIRLVEKGRLSEEEKQGVLKRLTFEVSYESIKSPVDLAIEAATENLSIKKEILQNLDRFLPDHAILATNTSSLPITALAAVTKRPEKVIGMHFMNPVPVMKLVEIIKGLATDDAVYRDIFDLSKALGKTPVTVEDAPGFVSNRILMPMINEAICTFGEGIASAEDIDTVMKLGMNHPMGPLELADFIGLDTCLAIMEVLFEGFGDSKYRPALKLKQMVSAGYLGRKTGRGFYSY